MKQILSAGARSVLQQLASSRTLCAFDFDGTLAPIVKRPEQAHPRQRTLELLRKLAALYPCIVVSGRARKDVARFLHGIPLAGIYGNHGAEDAAESEPSPQISAWQRALRHQLEGLAGVWVEDKGFSLAVHYRESPDKLAARAVILSAAAALPGASLFGGKMVVNVAAASAPGKGHAVDAERRRLRCDWVLYVGDDDNDEPAFALTGNVVAVHVGRKLHTSAAYFLRNQREIDTLLATLTQLKTR